MKGIVLSLVAASLTLAPVAAAAAEPRGYVAGSLMYVSLRDADFTDPAFPGVTFTVEADAGLGLRAALGTWLGRDVRGEVELAYRVNDLDQLCAVSCVAVSGEVSSLALLGNLYYDLPLTGPLRPYVGAGVGLARVELEESVDFFGDEDDVLAYQALLGVAVPLTDALALQLGYRYFATNDPTFNGVDVEYASHNLEAGLRIGF